METLGSCHGGRQNAPRATLINGFLVDERARHGGAVAPSHSQSRCIRYICTAKPTMCVISHLHPICMSHCPSPTRPKNLVSSVHNELLLLRFLLLLSFVPKKKNMRYGGWYRGTTVDVEGNGIVSNAFHLAAWKMRPTFDEYEQE